MNALNPTASHSPAWPQRLPSWLRSARDRLGHWPDSLLSLLARFSIAAVFWKSGQTKIEGLSIDLVSGDFTLGVPHLSDNAVFLFREEYRLPFFSPELGATLAALGEHTLPIFLLFGLATRLSALGLLGMTAVIQLFVYPDAYPTHGTWAAVLLFLILHGPGRLSLDAWIAKRFSA